MVLNVTSSASSDIAYSAVNFCTSTSRNTTIRVQLITLLDITWYISQIELDIKSIDHTNKKK